MRTGIVGPGRVGTALGGAFKRAGYEIVGVVSRNRKDATKCMRITQCNYWSDNPKDIVKISDLILIAVPDSSIEAITRKIRPILTPEAILVHTSGTLPASILGAKHSVSIHPIASFAGDELPKNTYFGIDGDVEIGKKLVRSIGGIPIVISSDNKSLYHAALNFGASYVLTLLNTGSEVLRISGIKNSEPIILSLASTTLRNAKRFGIKKSLTGPIERGNTTVIKDEFRALKEMAPEVLEIYRILAKEVKKLVKNTRLLR
ncbi:MAG: DUF2520 domain-containing protein [bacterium]|nr:DUF2520 domain-containing protein [bacterium]